MPEILAPVGNSEMLVAAVVNGADAVYLGLSKFSARSKAVGFDGSELKEAIDFAHLFGVKVYAAINTLIKNDELSDAMAAVGEAISYKVDALIIQDIGFAGVVRAEFPRTVLHASTQMGIHNADGAAVCKELGFSRIILARETLIEDIIDIKKKVDIELECFVQGALCIAFSGNCYFSSLASGYSGNRGKCMQLCRKRYSTVFGGKKTEGYLLSAKDLCLANRISSLAAAGIDCFKIEGRLRRPEYVAESVRVYKEALNGQKCDIDALKRVFNRGDYTEGHIFTGTNKVLDIKLCSHKGLKVGKVKSIQGRTAVLSCGLHKGDGVKFLRDGYEVGNASVIGDGFKTGYQGKVEVGDEVYLTTDSKFNAEVLKRKRKLPVKVNVDFTEGRVRLSCNDVETQLCFDGYEPAVNAPISDKDIIDCFNKSEYFCVSSANVVGSFFMNRALLNEVRRKAYTALRDAILADYESKMPKFEGELLNYV